MSRSRTIDRDRGWRDILRAARSATRDAHVKVGVFGDDERGGLHRKDPETGRSSPLTTVEIALVGEYGTEDGRIPARPAHRMTYDALRAELQRDAFRLLVAVVLDRRMSTEQALGLLGAKLAAAIRATIVEGSGVPPPNAPSTTARKEAAGVWNRRGRAQREAGYGPRPLVATGRTINAIAWAVVLGGVRGPVRYLAPKAAP